MEIIFSSRYIQREIARFSEFLRRFPNVFMRFRGEKTSFPIEFEFRYSFPCTCWYQIFAAKNKSKKSKFAYEVVHNYYDLYLTFSTLNDWFAYQSPTIISTFTHDNVCTILWSKRNIRKHTVQINVRIQRIQNRTLTLNLPRNGFSFSCFIFYFYFKWLLWRPLQYLCTQNCSK